MNIRSVNNINFGWHCDTHKNITQAALKDFPQFQQYQDVFELEVQKPDLDDIGFLANKHFYYAPEDGKSPMSFFDNKEQTNNAKSAYKTHVKVLDKAIENKDTLAIISQAARAMHFLQDMAQPQHTKKGSLLTKAIELKIHNDYEQAVLNKQDIHKEEYFKTAYNTNEQNQPGPRKFIDIFEDTASDSQLGAQITRKNEKNWSSIAQYQYNNAVNASREFLMSLSDMLEANAQNKS